MTDWQAIREVAVNAVYEATVSRSAIEFEWPECHRAKCQHQHGDPDEAFRIMVHRIAEQVQTQLLLLEHADRTS